MSRAEILLMISFSLLAFIPRAGFLARNANAWELESHNDEWRHLEYATNLVDTSTFGREAGVADAEQPPLYPLVLSPFVSMFGWRSITVLWFQILIVSAASGICSVIASWHGGLPAGIIAGTAATFYLPMVSYPAYFMTESISVLLFVLALLAFDVSFAAGSRTQAAKAAVANGSMLAMLALTRFAAFPLVLVSTTLILFRDGFSLKKNAILVAVLGVAFCTTYSPWVIRNAVVFQKMILLSPKGKDAAGFAFYCAMNIRNGENLGQARELARRKVAELKSQGLSPDHEVDRFSADYLANCFQRFRIMLGEHPVLGLPVPFGGVKYGQSLLVNWANYLWTLTMYAGLLVAVVVAVAERDVRLAHLILLPLALLTLYSLVHAIPRYQAVTFFTWSIPAGIGWACLLKKLSSLASRSKTETAEQRPLVQS